MPGSIASGGSTDGEGNEATADNSDNQSGSGDDSPYNRKRRREGESDQTPNSPPAPVLFVNT